MPIQSQDIKLLKSAVMTDESDGGGPMTGNVVVDGASNSLFPDISEMDLAFGRVNVRLVYGVAHTDDTDTLLGAHFIVEDGPDSDLVNSLLMEAPYWGCDRVAMREKIERNLVKGPRLTCRVMDTHYEGSQQVRLIAFAGSDFPAASDSIVLRNPDLNEQYVRVIKVTRESVQLAVSEGGGTAVVNAIIATCDLSEPLERDFYGPPLQRTVNEAAYAQVFSTTPAGGARFYGIKRLAAPAAIGESTAVVDGGIFSPLVPANRIEKPLQDQYPLAVRQSLSRTSLIALSLPAAALTMAPGTVLHLPTVCEPGSLVITRGATVFTDNAQGQLKQGDAVVGDVDYRARTVTVAAGAPNYGTQSTVIAYRPATPSPAAVHSDALEVTLANQGLVYTFAMEPPPAPGTYSASFMAQGRWYDLSDNGAGKVTGSDSSFGVGTLSYVTGSVSLTLGSPPDVGSAIINQWGDAASAVAISPAALPTRLQAVLPVASTAKPDSVLIEWARAGTSYTATVSAAGVVSGGATGRLLPGELLFEPAVLPDGDVTVSYNRAPTELSSWTRHGGGYFTLASVPVQPGSVEVFVPVPYLANFSRPSVVRLVDWADGTLRCVTEGARNAVAGSINYATGEVVISASVDMDVYERVVGSYFRGGMQQYYERKVLRGNSNVPLLPDAVGFAMTYSLVGADAASETFAPTWQLVVPLSTGLKLKTSGLAFWAGADLYLADAGVLKRGWNVSTGAAGVESAGSVSDGGVVLVSATPVNGTNAVTWINVAQDQGAEMVSQGVFRTANAPLKTEPFQIQAGALVGSANSAGVISGAGWSGSVDYQRGIVRWSRLGGSYAGTTWLEWSATSPVAASALSYNAVYFQFMPLNAELLGMSTARLPIDGEVAVHWPGGLVAVHHTDTTVLPNPLTQGVAYPLGRERLASVRAKTAAGATVDGALYTLNLDAGTITFPVAADLSGLVQPITVHHRVEDLVLTSEADLSGRLAFTRALTHNFPALTSFISGVLPVGDLFARAYGFFDQQTWTGVWSDERIGADLTASFNWVDYPVVVTNRGAISGRWALIFTAATAFRIVEERLGQIGEGSTNATTAPLNPATGAPFWSINPLSFGSGWPVGGVLRFNTEPCGAAVSVIRTTLQGHDVSNDQFAISFRGGVNA